MSSFTTPAAATRTGAGKWLEVGFYRNTCPKVERIVYNSMLQSYHNDPSVAPGVLRIAFHDCFVRGCDASVLLLGSDTERAAQGNKGLHGFEALDAAKTAVENACPGVVSAADVLQFAARDAVVLAGGYGWKVPAGRRDGRVSRSDEVDLPTSTMTASELLDRFQKKGLNADQLVVLSGAHTIGQAPCVRIDNRVHVSPVDPTLAPDFAASLQKQCPVPNDATTRVDLDSTASRFDTQYFKDILQGRGLLTSDQTLIADGRTKGAVYSNSKGAAFYKNFGKAMVAMSKIEVLTGTSGEIRRNIAYVN
jgi:peroxidase